jgi:sugar lactone lactonase YvrE
MIRSLIVALIVSGGFVLNAPRTEAASLLAANNIGGGGSITQIDESGMTSVFSSAGLRGPQSLAFSPSGNLYTSNFNNNTITSYARTGAFLGVFASAGLSNPSGLAFDPSGNLYVANTATNLVRKFSPTGVDLGVFASTGLNFPTGLAFDPAGNLYVASYNSSTIRRFSPTGADLGLFIATGLSNPFALDFDAAGNLFVTNLGTNTARKYSTASMTLSDFATSTGAGLTFDNAGNVYVAGAGGFANTIRRYAAAGVFLGVFASTNLTNPSALVFAPAAVPEPSGLFLAGSGFLVLLLYRWRCLTRWFGAD